mgnify:CR=1 FL=1
MQDHPFVCGSIKNFTVPIGQKVRMKYDRGHLSKWEGMNGEIIEYIATRTYGINLENGEYLTAWREDFDII